MWNGGRAQRAQPWTRRRLRTGRAGGGGGQSAGGPVAARMASTIQLLSDNPALFAACSAVAFNRSERRTVRRAVGSSASSERLGGVRAGGALVPRRRRDHDELGFAAAQPHLDGDAVELLGDLGRGVGEGLHQRDARRRLERQQQPLGGGGDVGAARRGHVGEIGVQALEVRTEFHDVSMTS